MSISALCDLCVKSGSHITRAYLQKHNITCLSDMPPSRMIRLRKQLIRALANKHTKYHTKYHPRIRNFGHVEANVHPDGLFLFRYFSYAWPPAEDVAEWYSADRREDITKLARKEIEFCKRFAVLGPDRPSGSRPHYTDLKSELGETLFNDLEFGSVFEMINSVQVQDALSAVRRKTAQGASLVLDNAQKGVSKQLSNLSGALGEVGTSFNAAKQMLANDFIGDPLDKKLSMERLSAERQVALQEFLQYMAVTSGINLEGRGFVKNPRETLKSIAKDIDKKWKEGIIENVKNVAIGTITNHALMRLILISCEMWLYDYVRQADAEMASAPGWSWQYVKAILKRSALGIAQVIFSIARNPMIWAGFLRAITALKRIFCDWSRVAMMAFDSQVTHTAFHDLKARHKLMSESFAKNIDKVPNMLGDAFERSAQTVQVALSVAATPVVAAANLATGGMATAASAVASGLSKIDVPVISDAVPDVIKDTVKAKGAESATRAAATELSKTSPGTVIFLLRDVIVDSTRQWIARALWNHHLQELRDFFQEGSCLDMNVNHAMDITRNVLSNLPFKSSRDRIIVHAYSQEFRKNPDGYTVCVVPAPERRNFEGAVQGPWEPYGYGVRANLLKSNANVCVITPYSVIEYEDAESEKQSSIKKINLLCGEVKIETSKRINSVHNGVLTGSVRLQRDNETHKLVFSADMYGNSMQFEPVGVKVTYIQYESPAEQLQSLKNGVGWTYVSPGILLDRAHGERHLSAIKMNIKKQASILTEHRVFVEDKMLIHGQMAGGCWEHEQGVRIWVNPCSISNGEKVKVVEKELDTDESLAANIRQRLQGLMDGSLVVFRSFMEVPKGWLEFNEKQQRSGTLLSRRVLVVDRHIDGLKITAGTVPDGTYTIISFATETMTLGLWDGRRQFDAVVSVKQIVLIQFRTGDKVSQYVIPHHMLTSLAGCIDKHNYLERAFGTLGIEVKTLFMSPDEFTLEDSELESIGIQPGGAYFLTGVLAVHKCENCTKLCHSGDTFTYDPRQADVDLGWREALQQQAELRQLTHELIYNDKGGKRILNGRDALTGETRTLTQRTPDDDSYFIGLTHTKASRLYLNQSWQLYKITPVHIGMYVFMFTKKYIEPLWPAQTYIKPTRETNFGPWPKWQVHKKVVDLALGARAKTITNLALQQDQKKVTDWLINFRPYRIDNITQDPKQPSKHMVELSPADLKDFDLGHLVKEDTLGDKTKIDASSHVHKSHFVKGDEEKAHKNHLDFITREGPQQVNNMAHEHTQHVNSCSDTDCSDRTFYRRTSFLVEVFGAVPDDATSSDPKTFAGYKETLRESMASPISMNACIWETQKSPKALLSWEDRVTKSEIEEQDHDISVRHDGTATMSGYLRLPKHREMSNMTKHEVGSWEGEEYFGTLYSEFHMMSGYAFNGFARNVRRTHMVNIKTKGKCTIAPGAYRLKGNMLGHNNIQFWMNPLDRATHDMAAIRDPYGLIPLHHTEAADEAHEAADEAHEAADEAHEAADEEEAPGGSGRGGSGRGSKSQGGSGREGSKSQAGSGREGSGSERSGRRRGESQEGIQGS